MVIEQTATEILIRLPKNVNLKEEQRFLGYLRFQEIAEKSEATQKQIDQLARDVNTSWWEKTKDILSAGWFWENCSADFQVGATERTIYFPKIPNPTCPHGTVFSINTFDSHEAHYRRYKRCV